MALYHSNILLKKFPAASEIYSIRNVIAQKSTELRSTIEWKWVFLRLRQVVEVSAQDDKRCMDDFVYVTQSVANYTFNDIFYDRRAGFGSPRSFKAATAHSKSENLSLEGFLAKKKWKWKCSILALNNGTKTNFRFSTSSSEKFTKHTFFHLSKASS